MLPRHFGHVPAVVVEPGVRTGIPVLTDNPREVGVDRIVNALAALTEFGGPAIVVDFGGTATTFDVVNAKGQYVGGAISPGIEVSLEALGRRGAQLREVELARPRRVIAKNTVEAVQSGMLFGVAAQVDGIVARMVAELGRLPTASPSSRPVISRTWSRTSAVLHRPGAVADADGASSWSSSATRDRRGDLSLGWPLLVDVTPRSRVDTDLTHYEVAIDLGNPNTSHTLARRPHRRRQAVLDVGCWTGDLGRALIPTRLHGEWPGDRRRRGREGSCRPGTGRGRRPRRHPGQRALHGADLRRGRLR